MEPPFSIILAGGTVPSMWRMMRFLFDQESLTDSIILPNGSLLRIADTTIRSGFAALREEPVCRIMSQSQMAEMDCNFYLACRIRMHHRGRKVTPNSIRLYRKATYGSMRLPNSDLGTIYSSCNFCIFSRIRYDYDTEKRLMVPSDHLILI
ncbi:hypothetical protein KP509_02G071800 [Ceratopteris richardii]|uniref:Uncharacterized protein n=1 Tax=Ceratopteris richardii TaxID=49495 RepID=A0A8T2V776_CERRI|nr:hypothetical protein KP509_02G071800 [Ceratopteris richardii]